MAGWAWVGLEKGCARGARAKKKIDRFGSHHTKDLVGSVATELTSSNYGSGEWWLLLEPI